MNLNLDQKHPDYLAMTFLRQTSRDLYDGFALQPEGMRRYLKKTQNETEAVYQVRLERAYYENLLEPAIRYRQALLWRKTPSLRLGPALQGWMRNVDGEGTSLNAFFQKVTRDADIDGLSFVYVDMPNLAESPWITSQADERGSGLRPYLRQISAEAVLDWHFNPSDKKLEWVVLRQEVAATPTPGMPPQSKPQWLVLRRTSWELYERTSTGIWQEAFTLIGQGALKMSGEAQVPLVAFYGVKYRSFFGLPIGSKILRHLVAIFNKSSEIDTAIWLTLRPVPYVIAEENPGKLDLAAFHGIYLRPGSQIGLLEPSGRGIELARGEVSTLSYHVFKHLLHINRRDSAQVQSAESQRQERSVLVADLYNCAEHHADSITQALRLFDQFAGEAQPSSLFQFNDDFDDQMITPEVIARFESLALNRLIPPKLLLQVLQQGEWLPGDPNLEQLAQQIEAQWAASPPRSP